MSEIVRIFAANLRAARHRRRVSQLQLATVAGVSVSYVSMLERAQRTPPLDTVDKLARALRTSPASLLTRAA